MNIRKAKPEDALAVATVHVAVWRSTYRGIVPEKHLKDLRIDHRAKRRREQLEGGDPRYCCFVAESESTGLTGFVVAGPQREGDERFKGEIYAIYLLEEFQGQGFGKRLFLEAVSWLLNNGYRDMLLWVLKENATRGFYQAMGGVEIGSKTVDIGIPLEAVSYGWDDLSKFFGRRI